MSPDPGPMPRDFTDLLQEFGRAGVEYVVVGAHALARHGYVRATLDLDVLVRPSPENAGRVFAALAAFGAPLGAHGVKADDFARPGAVYQVGLPPSRVDVLTSIDGLDFDDAWTSRVDGECAGVRVSFLGRDALLRNKRATGRDRDRVDADALERSPRPD